MSGSSPTFFQYRQIGSSYRPLLAVELAFGDRRCEYTMLLDTGADNIVLPAWMLDYFDVPEEDRVAALAGTFYGSQEGIVGPEFDIALPDLPDSGVIRASVVFSPMLDARTYGLLGREPTFDHLECTFAHSRGFGFFLSFLD